MTPELMQKIASYIELSAADSQATQSQLQEQATKTAHYQSKVDEAVATLSQHGFLPTTLQASAKQELSNPVAALDRLVKVALSQPSVPSQLGSSVSPVGGQPSSGSRRATAPRQRDLDYVASLGLPAEFAQMG